MKSLMMTPLLSVILLAGGSAFGAQVSIGVTIGQPPPPPLVVLPARPVPEYVWIEGYWYPVGRGRHWKWHEGYWTLAPYPGAYWVVPRYQGGRYFEGYWVGNRGRIEHDHRWDRGVERDYRGKHGKKEKHGKRDQDER